MLYRYQCLYSKDVLGGGGGLCDTYFFLHILSSCVKIRLHTKNQLPGVSGSALKVVVGWGGWVGWVVVQLTTLSLPTRV